MKNSTLALRQTESSLHPQEQLMRAQVERAVAAPAVIMVTSALPRDGKTLTAESLAACLSRSGYRTALVDLTRVVSENVTQPSLETVPSSTNRPKSVAMTRDACSSRTAMKAFVEESRTEYDYTILDASTLLTDDVAMGLAGVVDGLLLSVRLGRAPSELDSLTLRLIERSEGHVIGVVASTPEAIDQFGRRETERPAIETPRTRDASAPLASWVQITCESVTALAIVAAVMWTWSYAAGTATKSGFWFNVQRTLSETPLASLLNHQ